MTQMEVNMNGMQYITNKAYIRGLKHAWVYFTVSMLVVGLASFNAGRTFEYVQSYKQLEHGVQDLKVLK